MNIFNIEEECELLNNIRSIFSRVLNCKIDDIDINKSFFEQGGTSIKALQLVALLKQEISNEINIQILFDYLSINNLVQFISSSTINK